MNSPAAQIIIDDHIVVLWNEGKNTQEIADTIAKFMHRPFPEHQVCRVLNAVRANQAEGGAQ